MYVRSLNLSFFCSSILGTYLVELVAVLEVDLCHAVECAVPDPVVPVRDLPGDLLEVLRHRGLQHGGAEALDQLAQLVQALGALLRVLGLQALHQEGRHLARRVDLIWPKERVQW